MKLKYEIESHYAGGPAALTHGLVGIPLQYDSEKLKDFFRKHYVLTHDFQSYDDGHQAFGIQYDNAGEIKETIVYMLVTNIRDIVFDDFSTYAFVRFIRIFLEEFPKNDYLATSIQDLHYKPLDLNLDDKAMMEQIEDYSPE